MKGDHDRGYSPHRSFWHPMIVPERLESFGSGAFSLNRPGAGPLGLDASLVWAAWGEP